MTDDELKRLFEGVRQETAAIRQETAATHAETQKRFETLREENAAAHVETRAQFDAKTAELRQHFDVTTEANRHEIQLVAEKVMSVEETLHREAADIRGEMRRGFAETQAMFKFSHAELDRRMTTLETSHRELEENVADLQARVDRLESSTH